MKIAHTGDIHWGLGYPGPAPDSRFNDICRVMDRVADRIIAERCDLVLVAGDFFKDANVFLSRASVEISACVAWLRKLSDAGIPVVAINGTPGHDAVAAYDLIKEMRIPGITICTAPDVITFENVETAVSIACLPGLGRSQIASKEEYSRLAPHEIHQLMTQKITQLVMGMAARCHCAPDVPKILLAHLTCAGADKGFEDLILQQEPVLTKEAIEGSGFDLVCLGHIHRAQQVQGLTVPTFFCGSPERLRFDEEHNTPGFWIHELEAGYVSSKFIETPARRYFTFDRPDIPAWWLDKEANGAGGELATAKDVIKEAIVRVRYRATEEQARQSNPRAISRALYDLGAFYVAEIKAEIERSARARAVEASAQMGPLESLKLWCEVTGVPEKERADLASRTEGLLQIIAAGGVI